MIYQGRTAPVLFALRLDSTRVQTSRVSSLAWPWWSVANFWPEGFRLICVKMFDTYCVFHFDRFVKATISWLNLNVSVYKKRGQMRSLCAFVAMCVLFVWDPPQIPNFVIKNIGALQRNLVLRVSQRLCSQFSWPNFIIIYHIIHHNISCSLSLLSTRARTYSKRLRSWSRWVPPRTLWRAERSFYKGRFVERSH